MIPTIKHCILNSVPLKLNLPPTITSIAIYHQMAMIHVQVGKNFIEYVLVDRGSKVNIITKKTKCVIRFVKTKTCTLQPTHG